MGVMFTNKHSVNGGPSHRCLLLYGYRLLDGQQSLRPPLLVVDLGAQVPRQKH